MLYKYKNNYPDILGKLKHILSILGYQCNNYNDFFDDEFYFNIKKFQRDNNLSVDGIIGKLTLGKLFDNIRLFFQYAEEGKVLQHEQINTLDITPTYTELSKIFGNPLINRIAFEYKYIKRCDLSDIKKYYQHITLFHHRDWFGFRCHKLLINKFQKVFSEIVQNGLAHEIKTYDGCFNIRQMRNSRKISTHSQGIAIDLNAATNRLGTKGDMNENIVRIFINNGFIQGGHWKYPDPMHFQYCR